MKKTLVSVLIGLLAYVLTAVSANAALVLVHVYDFDFSVNPAGQPVVDPTINLGDTVHWQWDSDFHSTTAAAGQAESWNSGVESMFFTFEHTFDSLGVFNYYCLVHGTDLGGGQVAGMSGSITVVPEPRTVWVYCLLGLALIARQCAAAKRRIQSAAINSSTVQT